MRRAIAASLPHILGTIVLGLAFVIPFSWAVPYNMDEFIHYQTLICFLHPATALVPGACGSLDLHLLWTDIVLPLRAYYYSGSFPAAYYLPLHLLWPSPVAARFLGFLFLAAGAAILARAFRLRYWIVLPLLLAFFPYSVQHIIDTGPVGFQILSVYALYVLSERWFSTLRGRYPAAMAAIVFLCIWIKFSFFWLVPGLAATFIMHAADRKDFLREHRKRFVRQSAWALLALCVPLGILLLSTGSQQGEYPYLEPLLRSKAYGLSDLLNGTWLGSSVITSLLNPLAASQRIYWVLPPTVFTYAYSALAYLSVPLAVAAYRRFGSRRNRLALQRPLFLYMLFPLTILVIARTQDARYMHHAVLAFPFLILSACSLASRVAIRRPVAMAFAAVFVAANAWLFWLMPQQAVQARQDISQRKAHAVLLDERLAPKYLYVMADWGMSYYQGLYGPRDQSVYFMQDIDSKEDIETLKRYAKRSGRKLLFVYNQLKPSSDMALIERSFTLTSCRSMIPLSAWQILAEPDPALLDACERPATFLR